MYNFTNKLKFIFFSLEILSLFSCSQNANIDSTELKLYYETSNIVAIDSGNLVKIIVDNSNKINESKRKRGIDWKNAESFASVGALKSLSILKQFKNKIDTIVIIINYGNQREAYSYDVSILKQTNKFKTICDSFIRYVNTSPDSLNKIKRFLGNKIIGEVSDSKLKKLFKSNFLNIPINECRFMGMKVVDDIVSLYFNVYYNNGKAQTYAFSFYLNQDDKIDGINIP